MWISSINLVLRRALLSLSKDARVSKDGHRRDRARGHPSSFESLRTAARRARPPQDEVSEFDFDRAKLLVSQNRSISLAPACKAPLISAPFAWPTDGVAYGAEIEELAMKRHAAFAFAVTAALGWAPAFAQPASGLIDGHLAAAKKAAGFDFPGLLGALCVAPRNGQPPDVKRGPPPPDRGNGYTEPAKVFDDVYFVGTKDRSSWALTTPEGIILIDTTFEYESDEVIVGGLRKLGFDPASVKYVIISHAHPGEVGGAKLMQDRFGSRIIIGEGDWEMIEQSVNRFPNGKPKRDIVAKDGQKIALGGRTVTLEPMPGHTPGTVSMIFEVKDNGTPLTVAFSGGTEFNFVNDVPHFDTYINSARKFAAAAAAAGATVLMTNQSFTSSGMRSNSMLAVENAPTSQPARVYATHGAGAILPCSFVICAWPSAAVAVQYRNELWKPPPEPSGLNQP